MKIITLINTVNLILLVWVFFTITEESKISNRTFISKPIHTSIDNPLEDLSGETKQLTILYTMSCHRGHINPNAAIARELISRNHKVDILMTGLCAETAKALMPDANNVIALDIHPQKCLDPGWFKYPLVLPLPAVFLAYAVLKGREFFENENQRTTSNFYAFKKYEVPK